MSLPLSGIKVLDLTRALAGPFCTMILADLGADVWKTEPTPHGDMVRGWGPFVGDTSVYYLSINRNKRSIAIDFRSNDGANVLRDLAKTCDVIVENFKPGITTKLALDYETIAKFNPGVVYASISGFGQGGAYENWPGVDQIAQGMSGLMSLTGSAASGPIRLGIPIGDLTAGMWSAIGVLAAINQRSTTGRGRRVDTSLIGSLIGLLCVQGQRYLSLGEVPGPAGNEHPVIAPYGMFRTRNGPINVAVPNESMWRIFCDALKRADLFEDPKYRDNTARMKNRRELTQIINEELSKCDKEYWAQRLVESGIPAGPIFTLDEVFRDSHVRSSGCIANIEHPTLGQLDLIANPIALNESGRLPMRLPPPLLGEHTVNILHTLGYSRDLVESLLRSGTIIQTVGQG